MPVPSASSKIIFTTIKFFWAWSIFFEHNQIFWSWSKARFYLINLHIWAWSKIFEHIQKILNTVKNIWTWSKNIWTSRWIRHASSKIFLAEFKFFDRLQYFLNVFKYFWPWSNMQIYKVQSYFWQWSKKFHCAEKILSMVKKRFYSARVTV